MYEDSVKIPKERIAVLIGKNGKIKKEIEKLTKTKLEVDSKEGVVLIRSDNSVDIYNAKPVIIAIARGFNPEIAKELINEDNCLEIIDIKQFSGDSKKKLIRLKSRCIGTKGKAKINIEQMTKIDISIYGKTICIIGSIENASIAKQAIEMLLNGAPHGNVYRWIQNKKFR